MTRAWRLALAAVAALALGGAGARAADAPPAAPSSEAAAMGTLGNDLAGETCAWAEASAVAQQAGASKAYPILCGSSREPAGTLWTAPVGGVLATDAPGRRDAIVAAAKALPVGIGAPSAMSCGAAEPLLEGADNLVFACTLQSNGWPRIVVLAAFGRRLFEGEGLPALLPVLQQAIANLAGERLAPEATEAGVRFVTRHFPNQAGASSADAASYKALIERARLDGAARNFAAAEDSYRRALAIEQKLFGPGGAADGQTLAELALEVSNQGRFDEAAGLFRRARPIIEAAPSMGVRARFASYLALDAANQRHYADAAKYAHQATEMRRAELAQAGDSPQSGPVRGALAHSLRIEAEMALRLGDLPLARAAAKEALLIVGDEPGLPLWWRPDSMMMMAEIDARQGKVIDAEREFTSAIAMEEKLFGATAPTAYAELRMGQFYTREQVYPAAVAVFRRALDILAKDPVARASIATDQIIPFLTAAAALAEREPASAAALQAEMFRASQLVSSNVAGGTIARAAARVAADDPALAGLMRQAQEAQRQRDSARVKLAAEIVKTDDQRDAQREAALTAELNEAARRDDRLTAEIASRFPNYANFAAPAPAELATLAERLGPDEAFLTFLVGTHGSFALLVRHDGLTAHAIDATEASLAADVGELRKAFVPRFDRVPDFDLRASYELYRRLIAPFADRLGGVDHLVVAPGGALASLPLALLVDKPPSDATQRSYVDAAWLARRFAISEVHSPSAFLALRAAAAHHTRAPRPFLGVGDPSFTGVRAAAESGGDALSALAGRCRDGGPVPPELLRGLPPLHETADEVRTVARLMGADAGSVLLGAAATETKLRAEPLGQYAVLYFATHGLLPGELHCQSEPALVLSPPAAMPRSTSADGLLEASEIAALKLDADLVVLSACNTAASGGQFGGEALAGLADTFFNAGALAVLASHWQVPSLATVKLMTGLFGTLARDPSQGVAQALRTAQLALMAEPATAHPYYWAAFALIGDGAGTAHTARAPQRANPAEGRT